MYDFSKKSFSKSELEYILAELRASYETRLKEQKERIFELARQLRELKSYTEVLKKQNHQSLSGNSSAAEEKLYAISKKCQAYYNAIKEKYPNNDEVKEFGSVAAKIKEFVQNQKGESLHNVQNDENSNKARSQSLLNAQNGESLNKSKPQGTAARQPQIDKQKAVYKVKRRVLRPAYYQKPNTNEQPPQKVHIDRQKPHIDKLLNYETAATYDSAVKTQLFPERTEEKKLAEKADKKIGEAAVNNAFNPKERIEKYIDSTKPSPNIDLNEILSPKKELDLEELCKELGLM